MNKLLTTGVFSPEDKKAVEAKFEEIREKPASKPKSPVKIIVFLVSIIVVITVVFFFLTSSEKENKKEKLPLLLTQQQQPAMGPRETWETSIEVKFPVSGEGPATTVSPVRAYLNPLRSKTRVLGEGFARFVLVSDTTKFFLCDEKPEMASRHIEEWWSMPSGDYLIYPVGREKILFSWWQ